MNKLLLILLLLPLISVAGGKPCFGKKGGISHCEGSQFVCNNGSISKSKKDCSSYINGNSTFFNITRHSSKLDAVFCPGSIKSRYLALLLGLRY